MIKRRCSRSTKVVVAIGVADMCRRSIDRSIDKTPPRVSFFLLFFRTNSLTKNSSSLDVCPLYKPVVVDLNASLLSLRVVKFGQKEKALLGELDDGVPNDELRSSR